MAYPLGQFPTLPLQSDQPRQNSWANDTIPALKPSSMSGEKKQITRNRTSYSCKECRKRKIRCDKVHPSCGNCVKNRERCVYSTDSRSSTAVPESSPEAVRHVAKRRKQADEGQGSSSEDDSPNSNATKDNPPIPVSVEDRLDRLTSLVEALSRGKADEAAAHLDPEYGLRAEKVGGRSRSPYAPTNSNGNVDDLPHPLGSGVMRARADTQSGKGSSADRSSKSPGYEFDVPTSMSTEIEDPLSKLNLGYLSVQEGGRSRYVGSTWWAFVSDELDQLNVLLRNQNRYLSATHIGNRDCEGAESPVVSPLSEISESSMLPNSFHRSGDHEHHKKAQFRDDCSACQKIVSEKIMLLHSMDAHPSRFMKLGADLIADIPDEAQSHVLYRCWMSGVHSIVPIVGLPICLEKYNQFWDWYKKGRLEGQPVPTPPFVALLYAIWYAGSIIPAKEEEPMTISLFVGLAIRVAQTLGLHREPSLFNLKPSDAEVRRRIFWTVYQFDFYVAITSGLPPMMNEEFFDTEMVSELKDMYIGTKEGEDYERAVAGGQRPPDIPDNPTTRKWDSMIDVHHLVARARYKAAHACQRILAIHLGTKRITREDMILMREIMTKVDHELNEDIKRIPTKGIPEMGFTPDNDEKGASLMDDYDHASAEPPTEDDMRPFIGMSPREGLDERTIRYHWNTLIAFHKFARIMLSLLIDKVYCVSLLPLLKDAKSKFWSYARQCALRSCHGYMRKFIALATDPAFQPFQWSWPGMHQPMHATMIMLVDLHERPFSVEAPRSRAFIDKLFSMSTMEGGIVSGEDGVSVSRPLREGGREAWELLRKLREKAWQKAGLDPDVLWTEESQISAGIANPLTEPQRQAQMLRENSMQTGPTRASGSNVPGTSSSSSSSSAAGVRNIVSSVVNDMQETPTDPGPPRLRPTEQLFSGANGAPFLGRPTSGDGPMIPPSSSAAMPAPLLAAPTMAYFNPPTTGSLYTHDTSTSLNTSIDPTETLYLDPPTPSSMLPPTNPAGNAAAGNGRGNHDEDFWSKWDSILGSHAGFEDVMEDIKWDEMGNTNNDHDMMN